MQVNVTLLVLVGVGALAVYAVMKSREAEPRQQSSAAQQGGSTPSGAASGAAVAADLFGQASGLARSVAALIGGGTT